MATCFIRFTVRIRCESLKICVCASSLLVLRVGCGSSLFHFPSFNFIYDIDIRLLHLGNLNLSKSDISQHRYVEKHASSFSSALYLSFLILRPFDKLQ